ncbi:MAG: DsbA family protein [Anaerolineae bacterium]|nr:DsbA family protein [Anaerolineae bacterium]
MEAAKRRSTPSKSMQQRNLLIIGIIAAIAVIAAVAIIVVSSQGGLSISDTDYADIPQERLPDGGFVIGNPDAPVTVVEFADFACPHCQEYAPTMHQFVQEYVLTGQARFEYRMFISGADPINGTYTAQLAECADDLKPGSFWQAHDILFELGSRGRFNQTTARTLSDRIGLTYSDLLSCAGDASQYETDVQLGRTLNVQSTPTIMIRLDDNRPQYINAGGREWDRGPVPYEILQAVVASSQ